LEFDIEPVRYRYRPNRSRLEIPMRQNV
jgi:hypothetical protein